MEEKNKKSQILIKVCCVIAAFILWLYIFNVENPITERKIVVPVTIVNKDVLAQSKLVQVGNDQFNISLVIKGNASDVYSVKSSDFQLNSDLSSYVMKRGENNIPVTVKKSPDNISIANNENLWIKIQLDELKKKSIPIKVTLTGKPKEGYYALDPVLKMEKAEISGAQDSVNAVKYAVAVYDVKYAQNDINTTVSLQPQDASGNLIKNVEINPAAVKITVPVGKIKTVPVNVKIQGNSASGEVTSSITAVPDKIDISGNESVIKNISGIDTEPIDLSKIGDASNVQVKLVVPKGVKLINNNGIVQLKISSGTVKTDGESQKQLNLNIQIRNLNDSYTAKLSSSSASIVVSGSDSIVNNLNADSIACFVDTSSMSEGVQSANVVVSLPQGLSLVSQSPQNVNIDIRQKTAEDQNGN
ncbi:YbbR-like domain-containing protein [Clostridium sp. Mt-5]|uniref:YbbR-like domain-containing protein n=1 Tax=Clostridium moutaii TaxID=3240932 RepID=A0ABV4BS92_9CLOT